MLTKKNRVWGVVALLTVAIGFSSCLKSKNDVTPSRQVANISFLNVANIAVDPQFYDNGVKVADTVITYGFYSSYTVYGGSHNFELRKKGSDSSIVANNYVYDSTYFYTHVIYGGGTGPVRSATIKSDFTGADLNKINIRFIHLSPDAGPVDVFVGTEKIESARNFFQSTTNEEATRFKQYASFSVNDKVVIKAAGTETILANNATLKQIDNYFRIGRVYTIYLYGSKSSTGKDKIGVNAFYSYLSY